MTNTENYVENNTIVEEMSLLTSNSMIEKKGYVVPNFIGKSLKQSILIAKDNGLKIHPIGTRGRVTWQSINPGKNFNNASTCKIKLEMF